MMQSSMRMLCSEGCILRTCSLSVVIAGTSNGLATSAVAQRSSMPAAPYQPLAIDFDCDVLRRVSYVDHVGLSGIQKEDAAWHHQPLAPRCRKRMA